ncbi:nucleoside diphosphate kinase 4, chloroplastic-like [Triticum dicoccoides]|nr:nucleoside diphosphate kinase 4, chloroplastic-like [Triticum dicoccoides]
MEGRCEADEEVKQGYSRKLMSVLRLENIDQVLRYARLSGYLHITSRWTRLPGEPPIIDDADVDDWLPRFVVLQGQCLYYYLKSTGKIKTFDILVLVIQSQMNTQHYWEWKEREGKGRVWTRGGIRFRSDLLKQSKAKPTNQPKADLIYIRERSKVSLSLSHPHKQEMSKLFHSACKAARSLIASSSAPAPRAASSLLADGRNAALATLANLGRNSTLPAAYAHHLHTNASSHGYAWIAAIPAAAYMLQDQDVHAAEMERTFIAIKPDGVQRGLISEIVSRFERKGYKLVAIKLVVPSKQFAEKHYHDLKERPFFSGLCDFLSSGPVLAMVWEGEGVIKYGRKLIGATDPSKSEPGTIRGDLAVVVGRNIIHGSDGPETAKDEIALWFQPKELVSYTSNEEKWIYGVN